MKISLDQENQNNQTAEDGSGPVSAPEKKTPARRKKKGRGHYILAMLGCIAVLVLVMYLGTSLYVWIDDKMASNTNDAAVAAGIVEEPVQEVTYTQAELDAKLAEAAEAAKAEEAQRILGDLEARLSNGDTVVETLRPHYPDDIVLASGGAFHFVPIRDELKKNNLAQENLSVLESGEFQYLENGQAVTRKGIDVSKHQGEIDWQQVAQDGIQFAIIRVGLRGYGTGEIVLDEYFEANIKGAKQAGLEVGVYFYTQAMNEEEVLAEANFVLEQIAPYAVDGPVVYDVERVQADSARMNALNVEERTNLAKLFCQTIEAAGYHPMIYHNMEMGVLMLDLGQLEEYDKWFAYYGDTLYYPYAYSMWQYSDKGTVAGIKGNVDLNISFN